RAAPPGGEGARRDDQPAPWPRSHPFPSAWGARPIVGSAPPVGSETNVSGCAHNQCLPLMRAGEIFQDEAHGLVRPIVISGGAPDCGAKRRTALTATALPPPVA